MYKISDKIFIFITNAMVNRRADLCTGEDTLAEVKILRGIFFRDLFSLQQFVIDLMIRIYVLAQSARAIEYTDCTSADG